MSDGRGRRDASPGGVAYGPMTHVGEAHEVAATLAAGSLPALQALGADCASDPLLARHLASGALLPDLRASVASLRFPTHDRDCARHLLRDVAADPERSAIERALALGYASHVPADIAAQVFAVPHFTAAGVVGTAAGVAGVDDATPAGENELWVEGILDIYFGDAAELLFLDDYFTDPATPERAALALGLWLNEDQGSSVCTSRRWAGDQEGAVELLPITEVAAVEGEPGRPAHRAPCQPN